MFYLQFHRSTTTSDAARAAAAAKSAASRAADAASRAADAASRAADAAPRAADAARAAAAAKSAASRAADAASRAADAASRAADAAAAAARTAAAAKSAAIREREKMRMRNKTAKRKAEIAELEALGENITPAGALQLDKLKVKSTKSAASRARDTASKRNKTAKRKADVAELEALALDGDPDATAKLEVIAAEIITKNARDNTAADYALEADTEPAAQARNDKVMMDSKRIPKTELIAKQLDLVNGVTPMTAYTSRLNQGALELLHIKTAYPELVGNRDNIHRVKVCASTHGPNNTVKMRIECLKQNGGRYVNYGNAEERKECVIFEMATCNAVDAAGMAGDSADCLEKVYQDRVRTDFGEDKCEFGTQFNCGAGMGYSDKDKAAVKRLVDDNGVPRAAAKKFVRYNKMAQQQMTVCLVVWYKREGDVPVKTSKLSDAIEQALEIIELDDDELDDDELDDDDLESEEEDDLESEEEDDFEL